MAVSAMASAPPSDLLQLHNPPSTRLAKPRRPALKIPLPLNPWHPSPAPPDLVALIEDSLRAKPAPRRNQPDFLFTMTTSNPRPPPPTPVEGGPDDGFGTPLSEWSVDTFGSSGYTRALSTPGSTTPRMSGESERKSVRFELDGVEAGVCDDSQEVKSGRMWKH